MSAKQFQELNTLLENESVRRTPDFAFKVCDANIGLVQKQLQNFSNQFKLTDYAASELFEIGRISLYRAVLHYKGGPDRKSGFANYASKAIYYDMFHSLQSMAKKGDLGILNETEGNIIIDEIADAHSDYVAYGEMTEEIEEQRKQISSLIKESKKIKDKEKWEKVFFYRWGLEDGFPKTLKEIRDATGIKISEVKNILTSCREMIMNKLKVQESVQEKKEMLAPRDFKLLRYIIKCNKKEPVYDENNPAFKLDRYLGIDPKTIFPNREKILENEELSQLFFSKDTVSDSIKRLERFKGVKFEKVGRHNGYKVLNPEEVTQLSEKDLMISSVIFLLLKEYENTPYKKVFQQLWKQIRELQGVIPEDFSFLEREPMYIVTDPLPPINKNIFNQLYKACRKKRTIVFDYDSAYNGEHRHEADPYVVACHKGSWYLLAWQHDVQSFRWFSFSRFSGYLVLQGNYTPREDFKLDQWLDMKQGILWSNEVIKVKLFIHKEVSHYMAERNWYDNQTVKWQEDGSIFMEFETKHSESTVFPQDLVRFIMQWSPHIEVLEPESLKTEVRNLIHRISAYYD